MVKTVSSRILLMGDASHPMSPFKSQGANQALLDVQSLSKIIANNQSIKDIA